MEIEYHPEKKNPVDGPSWHPDYMDTANDKEDKTLHTIDYVTQGFIKHGEAQKMIENAHQATQQSKVISEVDNKLESHLTDNESLPYNTINNRAETLSIERNNMPNSNPIKTRKTFSKHKRKKSTKQAKKVLLRGKKKEVR